MTVEILNDLILVIPKDMGKTENIAILGADFSVKWNDFTLSSTLIIVPKGYATDGSSVPGWVPGGITNPMTGIRAAVIHDFAYEHHGQTKDDADALFDEMLKIDPNVSDFQRRIMVGAVRSEIGDEIYYGDEYVPTIVGQEDLNE